MQDAQDTHDVLLVLDGGSSLMGEVATLGSQGKMMVEAMNAMGYDAMTVGRMDLLKGLDVLQARTQDADFAILAANLLSADTGEPVLEPYTIIDRQGVRIGIIGLADPEVVQMPGLVEGVIVRDAVETIGAYLPELEAQTDLQIVLSQLGVDGDQALARALPGIDIIVGGKTRRLMQEPVRQGATLIVQQGFDGEWLGRLQARYDADGNLVEATEQMITLGADYSSDPDMQALVNDYKAQYPAAPPPSH